ncbi:hypothetical protein BH10PSE18_BH10PSE18_41260 [soil metagenome]
MTALSTSHAPRVASTLAAPISTPEPLRLPWYRYPLVWMVIAGPAAVVVAGFATLWIAIRIPDPVVAEDYYRQGVEINKTLADNAKQRLPALAGRNHAATPGSDLPPSPSPSAQPMPPMSPVSKPAN